jgi:hypothetical protein
MRHFSPRRYSRSIYAPWALGESPVFQRTLAVGLKDPVTLDISVTRGDNTPEKRALVLISHSPEYSFRSVEFELTEISTLSPMLMVSQSYLNCLLQSRQTTYVSPDWPFVFPAGVSGKVVRRCRHSKRRLQSASIMSTVTSTHEDSRYHLLRIAQDRTASLQSGCAHGLSSIGGILSGGEKKAMSSFSS